jgi:hypothetical protein
MHVPSQRTGFLAVGGVLLAATTLVAGLGQGASGRPLAGDCVDRDAQPARCTDAAGVYQVLTTVRGTANSGAACPRGDYLEKSGGLGTLCLGYNVAAGDCIEDDPEGPLFVPCSRAVDRPTFRVLSVIEDRANAKACQRFGEGAAALTYSVPAKTVCIAHLPVAAATD